MNDCKHLRRSDWQCMLMDKQWFCPWDDGDKPKNLCNDYNIASDYIAYIRVLATTRDKLKDMFPGQSFPDIVETLIQSYKETNK